MLVSRQWTGKTGDEDVPTHKEVMAYAITKRIRWRTEYEHAKQRARDGTSPPGNTNSATDIAASAA
ncbi:hypothetical protein [Kribbella sp. CA-294648]|uniref:hypothetical protein n=1 Tax=Kribbella sp. CA-294648 TaxID=3239948 RepID=UPI003D8B4C47